jgi:predicted MPP superfamily phosphohydrolase
MSPLRLLVFVSVMITLTVGTHYFLWVRLIRDASLPAPWRPLATGLLALLGASIPATMILYRLAPRPVVRPLAWVAFVWMGAMFLLLLATLGAELLRAVLSYTHGESLRDPDRRRTLARAGAAFASLTAGSLATTSVRSALGTTGVKPVRVALAKLPARLSGYRIVQLTDVHIGPTLDRVFLARVVAQVNAERPDMVVITGDLVDGSVPELAEHVRPLADLRAKDGVFFVTGNHEYYSGADAWIAHVSSLGIRVLRNERVAIGGEDGFDLAGVDDASAHQFGGDHGADYDRALGDRDRSRALVLLAHQPRQVIPAERYAPDLMISGHTHGGQIAPFNWLVKLQQPYVAGLYDHGPTKVYVSRGTGYWGPPMRLGAPAEITRIELVRA